MSKEKTTSVKTRIDTFEKDALEETHPSIVEFAFAGFSRDLTGKTNDSVVCEFCSKPLESWSSTDIPIVEHQKHAGYCPLFQIHTKKGRAQISQYGPSPFGDVAIKNLSRDWLILYGIDKNTSMIFCVNCDFICEPTGNSFYSATPKIKGLHNWHSPECKEEREEMDSTEEENRFIYSTDYFFYRLLSGQINIEKVTKYKITFDKEVKNNIIIETPMGTKEMSSSRLHKKEDSYKNQKESIQGDKKQQQQQPEEPTELEDAACMHAKDKSTEEDFSGGPAGDSTGKRISSAAEEEKGVEIEVDMSSSMEMKESPIERLVKEIAQIPEKIAQKIEKAPKISEEGITLIQPEGIVAQLSTFLTEEEKNTLPIKNALVLGLSRMMEQIRQITSQDIENVRLDMQGLFR